MKCLFCNREIKIMERYIYNIGNKIVYVHDKCHEKFFMFQVKEYWKYMDGGKK